MMEAVLEPFQGSTEPFPDFTTYKTGKTKGKKENIVDGRQYDWTIYQFLKL